MNSVIIADSVFTIYPNGWRVESIKMAHKHLDISTIPVMSIGRGIVVDRKLLTEIIENRIPPQYLLVASLDQ